MCGIAGFESRRDDASIIESLCESLGMRGPDGAWGETHGWFSMAQTRLAVIDLSDRVRYPLTNEAGDVRLVFNGEIYDYPLMRADLERRGHRFVTDCDAEVVVHGFEEWDVGVFRRLDGMFACAVLDDRDGRLVLARDRFGIKPLVHTRDNGRFAFASDALALVRAGLSRGEVDLGAVSEFAAFHYVPPPLTGLSDVVDLAPGSALIVSAEGTRDLVQWAPEPLAESNAREAPSLDELDAALEAAVKRQLVADVPVGVLLSSGIDSALLLSYAVDCGATPSAFTLAFPRAGDYDETDGASEVAYELGVDHHVQSFDSSFPTAIEGVSRAFDRPFGDSSAIATLQLAAFARPHVTVVLSGTGGDELFAGYYRVRAHRLRPLARAISPLSGRMPSGEVLGSERATRAGPFRSYTRRLLAADLTDDVSQYLSLVGNSTSLAALKLMAHTHDLLRARSGVAARFRLHAGPLDSPTRQLQRFEWSTYLPGDVLAKEDRATMDVGLEARVPLLDARLAELVGAMSDREMSSLLSGKRPLRRIAERRLRGIRPKRGKRGFAVPVAQLFAGSWSTDSREWVDGQTSQLVDTTSMARALGRKELSAPDAWALATLLGWEARLRDERVRSPQDRH